MSGAALHQLEGFWVGMAVHLWQTTLILAVLAALGLGLRLAPARYAGAVLWMGLFKLAVPLSWLAVLVDPLIGRFVSSGSAMGGVVEYVRVALHPPALVPVASAAGGSAALLYTVLTLAWLGGVVSLLVRWTLRSRDPRGAMARSDASSGAAQRLAAALRNTPVRQEAVDLVTGSGVAAVRGLLAPRILVSADLVEALTEEELRAVLLHEETHRRRHDTLLSAVTVCVLALFFFYPPAWWLVARLRAAAENACDESVLTSGIAPPVYARAVARVVVAGLGGLPPCAPTEAFFGRRAGLSDRLDRIENPWRYRVMNKHRWLLAVSSLVLLGSSVVPFLLAKGSAPSASVPVESGDGAVAAGADLGRLVGIDAPVTLKLQREPLKSAFDRLALATSTRFQIEGKLPVDVSVDVTSIPARELLERLAREHGLDYRVVDPWTVVVQKTRQGILIAGMAGVTSPQLIQDSKIQPAYPADAREARAEGTTIFQVLVLADGSIGEVELLRQTNPEFAFGEAGEAAIRQWRYEPATRNGEPVDVYFTVFVEFKLH